LGFMVSLENHYILYIFMNRRMTIMGISLLVVFGGLIVFNIIKQSFMHYFFDHFQPPAVTVSTVLAKQVNWRPHFSSVGNFVAVNGVDVGSQSAGKIVAIHFESGQYVNKDSPLVDIDDSVEQATLKYNQANLNLQKTNFQRQTDLLKRNATAISSVDEAKAHMLEAEASMESTQASIDLKHIKAPFSGMLGIRQINLGQFVQPGKTNIVSLQSLDPIYLHFYVPEQYIDLVHIDQNIEFTVEQHPNMIFKGKISAINSKIDDNTHNIEIQATTANCPALDPQEFLHSSLIKSTVLSNGKTLIQCDTDLNQKNEVKQFKFIPGMFASIDVEQPAIPNVIVLPTTAISYTMYGDSVFIMEKQTDSDEKEILTVKRVFIVTGETKGNYTVIKKGLKANQIVVAAGDLKLQNGTQITIDNKIQFIDHPVQELSE
ncbi:MAG TPA: efflux RND transporter periplasmic adaptor subunit, partial [Legionellaceae bacterium]|nr:efflux RND transporter periplasmic adaptor subunit [Legionellaceae bacterium]